MSAVAHIKRYKTGEFYADEYRGDRSWNGYERKVLLRNNGIDDKGVPRFSDVAMATGADDIKDGRGLAIADFDNDGALDMVINNNAGDHDETSVPPTLLRNNVGARRNWLAVDLVGVTCNRDAVGAVALVETSPARHRGKKYLAKQMRQVTAGSGYSSQHGTRLYFGLDDVTEVDKLTIRWPGGGEETFRDIKTKQLLRITQGKGVEFRSLSAKPPAPAGR